MISMIQPKQKEALLEQKYLTGSMPLLTPTTVYREHALAYPYHSLQGACPCLPLPQFTGSMPLLTPTTVYREHALAYPYHGLQGACPCLPPTTVYREHALAYPYHSFKTCG